MSFAKTGNCAKCGSPIWSPVVWNSVSPPPNHFTCNCHITGIATSLSQNEMERLTKLIDDLIKRVEKLENDSVNMGNKTKLSFLKD